MQKLLSSLILITSCLLLTACSREPQQEDLKHLYENEIKQTNKLASKVMQQQSHVVQLKKFEKIDCNKIAKTKDYLCRAQITLELPFLGEQSSAIELNVTKGENGWVMLD